MAAYWQGRRRMRHRERRRAFASCAIAFRIRQHPADEILPQRKDCFLAPENATAHAASNRRCRSDRPESTLGVETTIENVTSAACATGDSRVPLLSFTNGNSRPQSSGTLIAVPGLATGIIGSWPSEKCKSL